MVFSYDNLVSDSHVDPLPYCLGAQKLFEFYQNCVGRRQIETLLENYVDSMQAVKIARGHIYLDRLVLRIQGLEQKRGYYEGILSRDLTDLNDQFTSLRYLSEELQIWARGLRVQKTVA